MSPTSKITSGSASQTKLSASGKRRLPRLKRAPKQDRPGIHLTDRDIGILLALLEHRTLTSAQIRWLCFHDSALSARSRQVQCAERLKRLFHNEYIVRSEQKQYRSEPPKPFSYWLDEAGALAIAKHYECPFADLDWTPGRERVKDSNKLDHWICSNDVWIAWKLAGPPAGYAFVEWIDELTFRRWHKHDPAAMPIIPDLYHSLRRLRDNAVGPHLVEIDLSTVTGTSDKYRSFATKVLAYIAYFESPAYIARWGTASGRVTTYTTTQERLKHLKAITEEMGGGRRFWFTTLQRAIDTKEPAAIYTAPIWTMATEDGVYALL
jgi:Replication-relaxation